MTTTAQNRLVTIGLVALACAWPVVSFAQSSPYVGMEQREIKALSADDIDGYLAGKGMGFAKAAELNSYPGPKHVLELAESLSLSDEQRLRTQSAFDEMHEKAVRLGESLVAREQELDALFADGRADGRRTRALVAKIARIRGDLRLAHLEAHVAMREILSPGQVREYDKQRGYAGPRPAEGDGHEHREHGGSDCPHGQGAS